MGDDPASAVYVRQKAKAAAELGIHSVQIDLPQTATEAEVMEAVEKLNADDRIDGLLVQIPLPDGLGERTVVRSIRPDKDVDCQHPGRALPRWPSVRRRSSPQPRSESWRYCATSRSRLPEPRW